jgi:AraC-like DNA-binding protein
LPGLTVSAGLARGLLELAAGKGADPRTLRARSGIDKSDLEDQDGRIPLASYAALMRAAKEQTDDPALPLEYGGTVDMAEFSVVGMLFKSCETVLEALAQINRYGRLVVEVDAGGDRRFQLVRRGEGLWLVDTRRNADDFPELTEATFARFVCMTRQVVGELVEEVHVTHAAPAHAAAYDRFFRAPVRFEAEWNALRLDEARLTQPIRQEPRYVFGIFSERAEALLSSLECARTTRGRIEALLIPVLHTGDAGIAAIARAMGQSRQTVYRRLKAEGTTYEQVLDALRRGLALDYLGGASLSVNEAAYLLGFSDPAAFSRAFKRWTGMSPRAWRSARPR